MLELHILYVKCGNQLNSSSMRDPINVPLELLVSDRKQNAAMLPLETRGVACTTRHNPYMPGMRFCVKLLFGDLASDPHRLTLAEEYNQGRKFPLRIISGMWDHIPFKDNILVHGNEAGENGNVAGDGNPAAALEHFDSRLADGGHRTDFGRSVLGGMLREFAAVTGVYRVVFTRSSLP